MKEGWSVLDLKFKKVNMPGVCVCESEWVCVCVCVCVCMRVCAHVYECKCSQLKNIKKCKGVGL